jgi:general secretion pathway protein L
MKFYFSLTPPYLWASVDNSGNVLNNGLADDLYSIPVPSGKAPLIGVVPGEDVVIHRVSVPGRNRAKVAAAVPYALEETLAEDVEKLHFAILDWKPGQDAVVGVTAKEKMRTWLDSAAALGAELDILIPDYLLLPLHPQASITVVKKAPGTLVVKESELEGVVLDDGTLPIWWRSLNDPDCAIAAADSALAQTLISMGAAQVSEWNIGNNFTEWLKHDGKLPPVNLLQGSYPPARQQKNKGSLWPAVALLVLAATVKVGSDAIEYYLLNKEHRQLQERIVGVFRTTFPEVKRVVNPRVQMERRAAQLSAGNVGQGDFTYLLGAASAVLRKQGVKLNDLAFRDNALYVTCNLNDFSALDKLKQAFETEHLVDVELESSSARGKDVKARFKISRAAS